VNETNKTSRTNVSLQGFNCVAFSESVFWSSGYTSKKKGSTEYYGWKPSYNCSEINQSRCILNNLEVKSRVITNAQEERGFVGEGFVQISEPDELICDNPEQGQYQKYLSYESVRDGEDKLDRHCGRNKNSDAKCAIEIVDGNINEVSCYGMKVQASQYSITDVFEIKYELCWEI